MPEQVRNRTIHIERNASRAQTQLHIEPIPFNDAQMTGFMFVAYKTLQIDVCG
jgi:hypothetical protein